jgi:hypothetical protein
MTCKCELEVVRQLIAGALDNALRQHVEDCEACAETTVVAEALQRDASFLMHDFVLPPVDLVLWKARLGTQRKKVRTATRPIDLASLILSFFGVLSGGAYGVASGAFSRLAALPLVFAATALIAILFTAAPICLWKLEE